MTIDRETVVRLAREAGAGWRDHSEVDYYTFSPSQLERFAALVLEHERKPLTTDVIHTAAEDATKGSRDGTLQRIAFARGVWWAEKMHGITNKESSDA